MKVLFLIIHLVSSVTFTYRVFFTLHDLFRFSHAYAISEYKHMHNRTTLVWHYFLLLQSVWKGQISSPTHTQELVRSSVKSRDHQRGFPVLLHGKEGNYLIANSSFVETDAKSISIQNILLQIFFLCVSWKIYYPRLYLMGQQSKTPGCSSSLFKFHCLVLAALSPE